MARRKSPPLTARIFVDGRPLAEYTPEERAEFARSVTDRMGRVFNRYFSEHPDVYVKVCKAYDAEKQHQTAS